MEAFEKLQTACETMWFTGFLVPPPPSLGPQGCTPRPWPRLYTTTSLGLGWCLWLCLLAFVDHCTCHSERPTHRICSGKTRTAQYSTDMDIRHNKNEPTYNQCNKIKQNTVKRSANTQRKITLRHATPRHATQHINIYCKKTKQQASEQQTHVQQSQAKPSKKHDTTRHGTARHSTCKRNTIRRKRPFFFSAASSGWCWLVSALLQNSNL